MRTARRILTLTLVATLAACGSRGPKPIELRSMEGYDLKQEHDGLIVAVDPIFSPESRDKVFAAATSLPSDGVLPIQLIVQNRSQNDMFVAARSTQLVWSGHPGIPPSDSAATYERAKAGAGAMAAMILLAGIAGAISVNSTNEAIRTELMAHEFRDGLVGRDQTHSGILYFIPPKDSKITEATVNVAVLDPSAKTEINYAIAIPAHYFATISLPSAGGGPRPNCANCRDDFERQTTTPAVAAPPPAPATSVPSSVTVTPAKSPPPTVPSTGTAAPPATATNAPASAAGAVSTPPPGETQRTAESQPPTPRAPSPPLPVGTPPNCSNCRND